MCYAHARPVLIVLILRWNGHSGSFGSCVEHRDSDDSEFFFYDLAIVLGLVLYKYTVRLDTSGMCLTPNVTPFRVPSPRGKPSFSPPFIVSP